MKKILLETSFSKIYIVVMLLISTLVIGGYFSYAMFTVTKEKKNAISIVTGNLTYELLVDGENGNTLTVPANTTKDLIITLNNPNNRKARFNFYYKGNLPNNVMIGYLMEDGLNIPPLSAGINLEKNGSSGSSNIYKIKIINETSSSLSINLGVEVGLDYNDLTLPDNGHLFDKKLANPNKPILDNNMIAVDYNGSNFIKADMSNINNNWYNYDEQRWANAVTVKKDKLTTYQNANIGTVVSMTDIETMWVWIPRYSYTIGSHDGINYYGKRGIYLDNNPTKILPGEIDIKFITMEEKDIGTARYIVSDGIKDTSWYTPDGFTFGNEEMSGIWVGKFETSSSNPTASYGGGNVTNLDPMIKPNVTSWRYINVSNIHTVSTKVSSTGNRYGFKTTMNAHAMKNTEWAVVSYLSQSRYGKLENENYKGVNKEIYQNKSDGYITGCSYGSPSNGNTDYGCQYTYDREITGTGASTTGTIYGIYDMSGGAWDYVMANYNDIIGNSGFVSMPEIKYYDKYISDDPLTSCNGKECIGHGLLETSGWYSDYNAMVNKEYSWLVRGGFYYNTTNAGIHAFSYTNGKGGSYQSSSFRLAMSPSS